MGKNIFKIVIVAAMWLTAVSFPAQSFAAQLIFNSGFEADSRITGGYADITGIDRSVSSPNDWGKDTWDYDFNYVGGNSSQRKAEIVDDPTGATNSKTGKVNKVLHFWMREAPQGTNARTRVAAQIHQLDRTEWFSRRKIYVHPDMLLLSDFPGSSRVMFEEIKVIETSRDPHFRITLVWTNLGKSNFVWEVEGEDFRNQTFWGYQSKASLPIGEWFTAETYYKAGDKNTGRYVFEIQRKGKPKEVLFDVTNWTHHPNIPPAPADTWNPQKLYMSGGDDVDWIRNKGGAAQLYFDDWEVWSTKPDGGSTPTPTKKPTSTPSPGIQGDLDKDGDVDIFDYNLLADNFGSTTCGNIADIDGNCKVDIFDYNLLVSNFGKTSVTPTPNPERALCEVDPKGVWTTFDSTCSDYCWSYLSLRPCALVLTESCDCGPDYCWDGQKCQPNPVPTIIQITPTPTVKPTLTPPPPPPGSVILFESNWNTEVGASARAVTDGGRWPNYWEFGRDCCEVQLLSVVSDGVAGHNALKVEENNAHAANIQIDNYISESKDFYVRFYMKSNDLTSGPDHIVTVDTFKYPMMTFVAKEGGADRYSFAIITTGPCNTPYAVGWWYLRAALRNNEWYRFEYHVDYTAVDRMQVHVRIYDLSGNLLYQDADFQQRDYGSEVWNGRSDWTLKSFYDAGNTHCVDSKWMNDFGMGNNGQANSTGPGGWYFAAVQIRTDRWPGPVAPR